MADFVKLHLQVDLSNVKHTIQFYTDLYGDGVQDKSNIGTILRTCCFQGNV